MIFFCVIFSRCVFVYVCVLSGEKLANTRWNQCVLFTKVSPEDLFDSWLIVELVRGPDFLGECHVDMGRVSLDDRPVWFPFSAKGSSSHRGSISQIVSPGGNTPPSARELARRLRMRMAAGSQSQSGKQFARKRLNTLFISFSPVHQDLNVYSYMYKIENGFQVEGPLHSTLLMLPFLVKSAR